MEGVSCSKSKPRDCDYPHDCDNNNNTLSYYRLATQHRAVSALYPALSRMRGAAWQSTFALHLANLPDLPWVNPLHSHMFGNAAIIAARCRRSNPRPPGSTSRNDPGRILRFSCDFVIRKDPHGRRVEMPCRQTTAAVRDYYAAQPWTLPRHAGHVSCFTQFVSPCFVHGRASFWYQSESDVALGMAVLSPVAVLHASKIMS